MTSLIFLLLLASSFAFFTRTVWIFGRGVAAGVPDPRPRLDQLPGRLMDVGIYFFGQKKVAEEGPSHRTSKHHLFIFWGFLVITIATADLLVSGLVPSVSLKLLPALLYTPLYILIDVMNLMVLAMIIWAVIRRTLVRPALIPMTLDAGLILGAIGSLMLTHFIYHGYHIAGELTAGGSVPAAFPISGVLGRALAPLTASQAVTGAAMGYWLHILILLTFLNYLPYSKHIHLLGALPNIFTRNRSERRMDLPKIDLEDEKQWGVGNFEQFSWKSLLDTYACTECARCSNYCPAYTTGKNLSPMQLIHDIRYEMLDRVALKDQIGAIAGELAQMQGYANSHGFDDAHPHPDVIDIKARLAATEQQLAEMPKMTGGRIAEDTLWSCTTCGACQEVCPVFIEHPMKIIQMRQNLVLEQEKTPPELQRAFRNLERQSNPWGIGNDQRMDWAKDLDCPTLEQNADPEYILWIGCAGAFDTRIIKQTRAMVQVLNAAGVDYAVLGHQEGCTGDPARRAGNEMLFQMLAEQNIEVLKSTGTKKVITSCPHCLHTIKNDYPQFGGDFEVIHHTQLIAHLFEKKQLEAKHSTLGTVTYHDSCYLGRWNREFDAPRAVLEALAPPGGVQELTRNKQHGFCCGAGGGRMFMEEHGERVNINRADEIIATNVSTVAVACPFCNIMLTDGMKQRNVDDKVAVLDIAEIVAQSLDPALVPISALMRKKKPAQA
ncbi:MAG: 4Fe-4S dicluster domain-containing protein [Kofleriaceae bacterium]|nr:4Fe-4S dicluster domain-containing protein [Kofleriaceae bacterium]